MESRVTGLKKSSKGGFTIVEAMVASMVLLLAMGSVLALASQGFRYIGDLRRYARSSQVLQQKLEDVRLITQWSRVQALNNTTFSDQIIPGVNCSGKIVIDSYSPYPSNMVVRVTITATWTNSMRRVVTNRITSLVCNDGLSSYIF